MDVVLIVRLNKAEPQGVARFIKQVTDALSKLQL
jgi:hypothetical protein